MGDVDLTARRMADRGRGILAITGDEADWRFPFIQLLLLQIILAFDPVLGGWIEYGVGWLGREITRPLDLGGEESW